MSPEKPTKPSKKEEDESLSRSLDSLLEVTRKNRGQVDESLIKKAFEFSRLAHVDQKRRSGEPYFHHPLEVAKILAEFRLDSVTIATGLLHDTVEDTLSTIGEIQSEFGEEIALLVDGVTKISKITFQTSEEKQAENFRKMVLAMAKDLRVIIVKLADRLHNMRTLQHMKPEKQVIIAQETLDIYSPLANRLGLSSLKRELEDLSLRFTKPEIYYRLVAQVSKRKLEREQYVSDVQDMIRVALDDNGYRSTEVTGRPKHFYSIHRKMEKRDLTFDQIFDITGFRILLESVEQCYGVLGLVHTLWTPVPGRFKDYIAIPKANFYQSLHTTVIGPQGERVEFQIRTREMDGVAERGIAAHWAYKEEPKHSSADLEKFRWLNRLVECNQDLSDPNEFLESVKLDLFSEDVYVFTPKGQVLEFPQGSTPLDFAYSVHTDVGNQCIGAKVNSRMVPLKYKLKSGDTIEVLTSSNQRPNKDWLKIVKTSRAKNKIRSHIKIEEHERSKAMGEVILERELRRAGVSKIKSFLQDGSLLKIAESFTFKGTNDLLSAIGYGKVSIAKVMTRLVPTTKDTKPETTTGPLQKLFKEAQKKNTDQHAVKVMGVEDLLVRFARCCNPVPGDAVIGFITRGRGISVHARNCDKVLDSDPHRLVEIEWDLTKKSGRRVKIRIVCEDRAGLLAEMSAVIRDQNVNVTRAQIGTTRDNKAVCHFTVTIQNVNQLKSTISAIEGLPGVISVERVRKRSS